MQLLNKMEEQKFIDLMFMIMLTSKVEDDFASNVTEFIRKNGLPFKNCLEIKESSIHGKGVFAKRDISSGMIVGVYPCHGVIEDRKYSFIPLSLPTASPLAPNCFSHSLNGVGKHYFLKVRFDRFFQKV
jgi:hypothetical protein